MAYITTSKMLDSGSQLREWDEVIDDPLLPTETFLEFYPAYVKACADSLPLVDSIGTYSAGWQL